MSKGIYKYTDLKTGEIVYIGKDSHIDRNKRHGDHLAPSKYDEQQINRVLQNNPNRYEYGVIWEAEDCTTLKLNKMEILFGKIYNPKFNFDKFGKGGCNNGYWKNKTFSDEHKQNISESLKGKTRSDEHKQNLSESLTGRTLSEEHRQKLSENHADVSGENHPLWKDYPRIIKQGHNRQGKRRYGIKFNGKVIKQSISIDKLEKWFEENYPNEELIIE